MKQKSWTWMLAAMLTLCGTTTVMTSCSDDDSTTSGSTPSQEIDEQLLGSWTMDVDGIDSLDLATLDLRFNKDQTMQLVINCYNAESDGYLSVPINASYHAIDPKDINGTTAKGLEVTLDADSLVEKDTLYYQVDGGKFILKAEGEAEDELFGDMTFSNGATDTATMDKKTAKEFIQLYQKLLAEYDANQDTTVTKATLANIGSRATSSTGHERHKWMEDIPDDRMVCQLLIPGTHDAATFGLPDWMLTLGRTQMLNWSRQFAVGIRAFDIRTRQFNKSTYLFHSMLNCNIWFGEALDDIADLLKANPSEGIVLLVSGESNDMGSSDKWHEVFNGLLQMLPASLNADKLHMEETTKENLRLIEEKLKKPGLLAKYSPDMKMKDLRGKALVWLVNQPDNWDLNNSAYDNLRDYLAVEKNGNIYSLDGSSVKLLKQNDWECPDNKTKEQFAEDKGNKFDNLLKETTADRNGAYWCYNAANAYYKELSKIPDYVTFARMGYPKFINSLKNNPGGRGIVVQDFAWQDDIRRVDALSFFEICGTCAVFLAPINFVDSAVRGLVNSFLNLFGSKKRWENNYVINARIWAAYKALQLFAPSQNTHGRELTDTMVESNF